MTEWNEEQAAKVLIASISTEYLRQLENLNTVDNIMQVIFKTKYPEKNNVKYFNQLTNIRQNNFLRISDFRDAILDTIHKLGVCLNLNNEMREMKTREAFYYGLSKRSQLEMIRLNIHNIDDMYTIIDSTEAALLEQMKENSGSPRKKRTHETIGKINAKKLCIYHQTSNHDKANFRVLQKRGQDVQHHKSYEKPSNLNEKRNTVIKELKIQTQLPELEASINDKSYIFLLDTGSALSYISEEIIEENNIPTRATSKCMAMLVDGSSIESSKEATLEFNIQGDTTRTYKTTTRVLRSMSLPGILGMNFLLENDACIDFASGIITLDNKSYELKIKKDTDQLDSELVKRTRINVNLDR